MVEDINKLQNANSVMADLSVKKSEATAAAAISASQKKADASVQAEGRYDTFEKSLFPDSEDEDSSGIYSENKIAAALKDAQTQRQEAFKDFIRSMITDQAEEANFSFMGLNLKVTEADSQKALESISDGGEYSVDSVATRIMDMAEALAGGDASKISMLRDAVIEGFGDAAKRLGLKSDEMPDITKKTYAEVMDRFDKWEQSFNTEKVNDATHKDTAANQDSAKNNK